MTERKIERKYVVLPAVDGVVSFADKQSLPLSVAIHVLIEWYMEVYGVDMVRFIAQQATRHGFDIRALSEDKDEPQIEVDVSSHDETDDVNKSDKPGVDESEEEFVKLSEKLGFSDPMNRIME